MKKIFPLVFVLIISLPGYNVQARNLWAFLSYSTFNSPDGPYIETYLSVAANSVKFVKNDKGKFQATINILMTFKQGNDINTFKHKILTRLMLSTTIGEATVIMREVLGNGLIPTLNQNAIEFTPEGKTAEERSDA